MTASANPLDLTGKVALVTGGSRGLGRDIVLGLAEQGADVVITSRRLDACEAVADEVRAKFGRRALPFACHIGHWDEIPKLVDATYAEFGRLDVLVNNAGMSPTYDDVVNVTEEYWDKVFAVNVKGPFRLTALAGTRMKEAGSGSIIMVGSSGAVFHPRPHIIPYSGAKAGLNAISTGFARAFGPAVRVNCVHPGPFLTDAAKAWDTEAMSKRWAGFALQRAGQPKEFVGAILYFASDASSFTTGATLCVDGGE